MVEFSVSMVNFIIIRLNFMSRWFLHVIPMQENGNFVSIFMKRVSWGIRELLKLEPGSKGFCHETSRHRKSKLYEKMFPAFTRDSAITFSIVNFGGIKSP